MLPTTHYSPRLARAGGGLGLQLGLGLGLELGLGLGLELGLGLGLGLEFAAPGEGGWWKRVSAISPAGAMLISR